MVNPHWILNGINGRCLNIVYVSEIRIVSSADSTNLSCTSLEYFSGGECIGTCLVRSVTLLDGLSHVYVWSVYVCVQRGVVQ